jgi:hypothetical protein
VTFDGDAGPELRPPDVRAGVSRWGGSAQEDASFRIRCPPAGGGHRIAA